MAEIYLVTHIQTGSKYVGQAKVLTQSAKPYGTKGRWLKHISEAFRNLAVGCLLLDQAIRTHGVASFTVEIICTVSGQKNADIVERFCIAELGSQTPHGFNITAGGSGRAAPLSQEHKRKISDSNQKHGKGRPMYLQMHTTRQMVNGKYVPVPDGYTVAHPKKSGLPSETFASHKESMTCKLRKALALWSTWYGEE
jgi:hypothetical protein